MVRLILSPDEYLFLIKNISRSFFQTVVSQNTEKVKKEKTNKGLEDDQDGEHRNGRSGLW